MCEAQGATIVVVLLSRPNIYTISRHNCAVVRSDIPRAPRRPQMRISAVSGTGSAKARQDGG